MALPLMAVFAHFPIHGVWSLALMNATATENRLTMGPISVPEGSHELAVIPEVLEVLELNGCPFGHRHVSTTR